MRLSVSSSKRLLLRLAPALTAAVAAACSTDATQPSTIEPLTPGWNARASMPDVHEEAAATAVGDLVYVIGGIDTHGNPGGRVDAYDAASDRWREVSSVPGARQELAAATVNGVIYVFGGVAAYQWRADVEAFDPARPWWRRRAPMPEGRSDAAAAVIGGTVYIVGGRTWTPDSVFMDNSMWAYDAASDHWTIAAPIPTKRAFLAVGVVNGVLYAIGGDSSTGGQEGWGPCCLNTVEAYDPSTNTWTSKAPLHTPRAAAAAAVVNGTLYVFGGENNGAGLSSVEAYDPATDSWTELGSMPYSRLGMVAAASHGAIFALGGIARDEIVADNQAFVP